MMALLGGLLPSILGWLVPALAGLLGAVALLFAGRRQGRTSAEAEARRQDIENRDTRDAVERDVGRRPDAAERLRADWSRD